MKRYLKNIWWGKFFISGVDYVIQLHVVSKLIDSPDLSYAHEGGCDK